MLALARRGRTQDNAPRRARELSLDPPRRWAGSVRSGSKNDLLSWAFPGCMAAGVRRQEVTLMVHDDRLVGLDDLRVCFDDERVVSDAGIVLAATLAQRLGIEGLVDRFVRTPQTAADRLPTPNHGPIRPGRHPLGGFRLSPLALSTRSRCWRRGFPGAPPALLQSLASRFSLGAARSGRAGRPKRLLRGLGQRPPDTLSELRRIDTKRIRSRRPERCGDSAQSSVPRNRPSSAYEERVDMERLGRA